MLKRRLPKLKVCLIVHSSFIPFIRYGAPYTDALALKEKGNDVVVISVSSESPSKESFLDCGKIISINAKKFVVSLPGIDNPLIILIRALEVNADIYYVYATYPLLVAILLKLFGKKVIYAIQDDHASFVVGTLMKKYPKLGCFKDVMERSFREFEGKIYKIFDYIVTLSDTLKKDRLVFTDRIKTIPYCPHPVYTPQHKSPMMNNENKSNLVLVYEGEISKEKGLVAMLETLHILSKKLKNIKLLFIGSFSNKHTAESDKRFFENYISKLNLTNMVEVTGWVPYKEVPRYLNSRDIGLVLLRLWCRSYRVSIPVKALDMLSCGLPIVASKGNIELENLIKKSKAGVLVDSENPEEVANTILSLIGDSNTLRTMNENAINYMGKYHNWNILKENLSSVLEEVYSKR